MNKENQKIEYKSSWRDEYLKWICGFANSDGGKLYIGIDDDGKIIGVDNAKKLLEDIPNKIADTMTILPRVNLIKKNKKEVIEIIIDNYHDPISFNGKFYKRVGATNREVDGNELRKIFENKYNIGFVDYGMDKIKLTDIDSDSINIFKEKAITSRRMSASDLKCGKKELLEKLNLIDDNGKIKRAGVLLFHKDPQKYFLNSHIKIGFFDKNDADLVFQDEIYGSLIKQVDTTMNLIFTKYLKGLIYYKGVQRIDQYPIDRDGFREILINAIIHKDYSIKNPIQISVYKDKVYIFNEGEFPEKLNTEDVLYKKHSSKPYNPTIANVFYKAGFIEGWGRGFEKIMEGIKRNPGVRPEYKIDESGVMVCYKACKKYMELLKDNNRQNVPANVPVNVPVNFIKGLSKTEEKVLEEIMKNKNITRESIATELSLSIKTIARAINTLKEKKMINRIGSDKKGYWKIKEMEDGELCN